MLIRNAGLLDGRIVDVRVDGPTIAAIGEELSGGVEDAVLDARGGALLPGLHDHHLHLMALAAALESLRCGPPEVRTAEEFARRLHERAAGPPDDDGGWIRGIGYHESVAGDIDCAWLDRVVRDRPVRIQHRSGRLWILNSCALERLRSAAVPTSSTPLPDPTAMAAGRLLDVDGWLRERLAGLAPSLGRASVLLASHGITGITDAGARNSRSEQRRFVAAAERGELLQRLVLMGDASLDGIADAGFVRCGPTKIYLREAELPTTEELVGAIRRSHSAGRPVAVHCVTQAELVYAAMAIGEAGARSGDRIEHASVAPPAAVALLAAQGLTVVTQPNFVRERGDAYLADVPAGDHAWLYRGRGFLDAGIRLAAGTDAPLGDPNPWLAMQAAVDRKTELGGTLGEDESLTPEQALALFGGDPLAPGRDTPAIGVGTVADLCLLDRPWRLARRNLAEVQVNATLREGRLVWRRA